MFYEVRGWNSIFGGEGIFCLFALEVFCPLIYAFDLMFDNEGGFFFNVFCVWSYYCDGLTRDIKGGFLKQKKKKRERTSRTCQKQIVCPHKIFGGV